MDIQRIVEMLKTAGEIKNIELSMRLHSDGSGRVYNRNIQHVYTQFDNLDQLEVVLTEMCVKPKPKTVTVELPFEFAECLAPGNFKLPEADVMEKGYDAICAAVAPYKK